MACYSLDKARGFAVHGFTSLGAAFGLLALVDAARGSINLSFMWLGAALVVDGIDGSLARWARVSSVLPRFSGRDLDHVIDYLNYVIVPSFIVATSGIVSERFRSAAAILIALSSLYHFSDSKSKTTDGQYFVGFPAIWNIVVFLLFAFALPQSAALAVIAICTGLIFVPLTFAHPFRLKRLRPITFGMAMLSVVSCAACLYDGFPAVPWEIALIAVSALYFIILGLLGMRGLRASEVSYLQ